MASCAVLISAGTAGVAEAQTRRVDLQFLVVTGGSDDYGTPMVRAGLDEGLVPYTVLDLTAPDRPQLDEGFLVDTSVSDVRRGRFQAVVLPNARPSGLGDAELAALARYEREFHVRQLDAYVAPSDTVGLGPATASGTLDGATANVTNAGSADAFSYLQAPVQFEDIVPSLYETYGYLAAPLAAQDGRTFTPFMEATLPGGTRGTILGAYSDAGREEMVLMVSMNPSQLAQQLLFPGIVSWLSQGVHLGRERVYLSVHVDDLFQDNGRWSPERHCTLGDECEGTVRRIMMTSSDVDHLASWQTRQGLKLHLAFNGGAYAEELDDARKATFGAYLLRHKDQFLWINHTYTHEYLGCVEDEDDGSCQASASGALRWTGYQVIYDEIERNIRFAQQRGLPIDRRELVTGQHSGLRRPPREPTDNPNLVRALSALGVAWAGSDNSVESPQRAVTPSTLTVPRYPMNIYYNAGTKAENTHEYNWFYTSKADGGSGACEPSKSCQPKLDPRTGFDEVIVPSEVRTTLMHMLANDPRPHYAHQSNLAEDRILLPVIEGVLKEYRRLFNANAPIVNPTMAEAGSELKNRASWLASRARVEAYVQDGEIHLSLRSGAATSVPVTVAAQGDVLEAYSGTHSGWQEVASGREVTIPLAASVGYPR